MASNDENTKSIEDNKLTDFEITELTKSRYINPYRIKFNQNDQKRVWDGIMAHASVSCIIYDTDKKSVILVRQFRPVVYINQLLESQSTSIDPSAALKDLEWSKVNPNAGITYELCAGICDKSKSLEETIKEEIYEECGYTVKVENIHRVRAFRAGVGLIGCLHTVFYAEVNASMKTGTGGGNKHEGEYIELFELPETHVKEFLNDESKVKPPGLLYGLMWFMYERKSFFENKNSKS